MKKILNVLPVVLIICMILADIFAADINMVDGILNQGNGVPKINNTVREIWTTISLVIQLLAITAIVFAGLRYMFASADQKADIKKSMGILAVGSVLVFATTTVLNFIARMADDVLR